MTSFPLLLLLLLHLLVFIAICVGTEEAQSVLAVHVFASNATPGVGVRVIGLLTGLRAAFDETRPRHIVSLQLYVHLDDPTPTKTRGRSISLKALSSQVKGAGANVTINTKHLSPTAYTLASLRTVAMQAADYVMVLSEDAEVSPLLFEYVDATITRQTIGGAPPSLLGFALHDPGPLSEITGRQLVLDDAPRAMAAPDSFGALYLKGPLAAFLSWAVALGDRDPLVPYSRANRCSPSASVSLFLAHVRSFL
jgi:hypothetical protein